MEGYNSMVFYSSFFDSIETIPDDKPLYKLDLVMAILKYGLYGIEPQLEWPLSMAWEPIKPQIDANIKRRENGQKGGRKPTSKINQTETKHKPNPNQTETKQEPNPNQTITKSEPNVNDNVNINENIYDNYNDDDNDNETTLSDAVKYYIDYINPAPSMGLVKTIESYLSDGMTDECLIAIFEYCQDNNKTNWAYIKKAVEGCFNQGVRTREDYLQSRALREQSRGTQSDYEAPPPPPSKKKNSFHNFEERDFDPNEFDDIYFAEMYGL